MYVVDHQKPRMQKYWGGYDPLDRGLHSRANEHHKYSPKYDLSQYHSWSLVDYGVPRGVIKILKLDHIGISKIGGDWKKLFEVGKEWRIIKGYHAWECHQGFEPDHLLHSEVFWQRTSSSCHITTKSDWLHSTIGRWEGNEWLQASFDALQSQWNDLIMRSAANVVIAITEEMHLTRSGRGESSKQWRKWKYPTRISLPGSGWAISIQRQKS
jgi:hypothetical protein